MSTGGDDKYSVVIFPPEKQIFADGNWKYAQREQMFIHGQARKVDISFLGDSITERLEWQEYYPNHIVANRGIGSDTTLGAFSRLDSVIANKPKVISVLLGINDLAQGRTPDEIIATYCEIIMSLKEALPKTRIIISSIFPVKEDAGISASLIHETNERLKRMCVEFDIACVDAFSILADEDGYLREEHAIDTVHLTVEGYLAYLSCLNAALDL